MGRIPGEQGKYFYPCSGSLSGGRLLLNQEAAMSDSETSQDDDDDDNVISLDELEKLEKERARPADSHVDEDDWGDSYDDLDGEAWERQYQQEEDEVERDPWELG
jgi:hypothetical protein